MPELYHAVAYCPERQDYIDQLFEIPFEFEIIGIDGTIVIYQISPLNYKDFFNDKIIMFGYTEKESQEGNRERTDYVVEFDLLNNTAIFQVIKLDDEEEKIESILALGECRLYGNIN